MLPVANDGSFSFSNLNAFATTFIPGAQKHENRFVDQTNTFMVQESVPGPSHSIIKLPCVLHLSGTNIIHNGLQETRMFDQNYTQYTTYQNENIQYNSDNNRHVSYTNFEQVQIQSVQNNQNSHDLNNSHNISSNSNQDKSYYNFNSEFDTSPRSKYENISQENYRPPNFYTNIPVRLDDNSINSKNDQELYDSYSDLIKLDQTFSNLRVMDNETSFDQVSDETSNIQDSESQESIDSGNENEISPEYNLKPTSCEKEKTNRKLEIIPSRTFSRNCKKYKIYEKKGGTNFNSTNIRKNKITHQENVQCKEDVDKNIKNFSNIHSSRRENVTKKTNMKQSEVNYNHETNWRKRNVKSDEHERIVYQEAKNRKSYSSKTINECQILGNFEEQNNSIKRNINSDPLYFNEKFSKAKVNSRYSDPKIYTPHDMSENSFELDDEEYSDFYQKYISQSINDINIKEIIQDLFEMPHEYALAHCVAEDFRMGEGIAVAFKETFQQVNNLLNQGIKQGGFAYLEDKFETGFRYIYYLVTKEVSSGKPTYETLWSSLKKMRDHMKENEVQQLAIPRLGCGLDKLEWSKVKSMIGFLFRNLSVEIVVCIYSKEFKSNDWD